MGCSSRPAHGRERRRAEGGWTRESRRSRPSDEEGADWQRRVVGRSLTERAAALDRPGRAPDPGGGEGARAQRRRVAHRAGGRRRGRPVAADALPVLREQGRPAARRLRGGDAHLRPADPGRDRRARASPSSGSPASLIASARLPELHDKAGRRSRPLPAAAAARPGRRRTSWPAPRSRSPSSTASWWRGPSTAPTRRPGIGVDGGAYLLSSVRTALTSGRSTLGNEFAVELPDPIDLSVLLPRRASAFSRPRAWHEDVRRPPATSTGEDGRSILRRLAKGTTASG